jgi:L-rhamnose mutarotase
MIKTTQDSLKEYIEDESKLRTNSLIQLENSIIEEYKTMHRDIMNEESRAINAENNLDNMIKNTQDTLNQSIENESKIKKLFINSIRK